MTNIRKRIHTELKHQQKVEGYTPETGLLFKTLPLVKTASEWNALTMLVWQDGNRFYYPSDLLNKLIVEFGTEND